MCPWGNSTFTSCSFVGNTALAASGAVWGNGEALRFVNCEFINNTAEVWWVLLRSADSVHVYVYSSPH